MFHSALCQANIPQQPLGLSVAEDLVEAGPRCFVRGAQHFNNLWGGVLIELVALGPFRSQLGQQFVVEIIEGTVAENTDNVSSLRVFQDMVGD